MTEINENTVAALVALGAKETPVHQLAGANPFVVIPQYSKVEDLAHLFPPARIVRDVTLLEAESFAGYVNRFKTVDTLIFAQVSETGVKFTAMLDYHSGAPELKPAYCSHAAVFSAIETPEWKVWRAANKKSFSQVEFAELLEENASLFVSPTGAALLELVVQLFAKKDARFNQSVRLPTGANSVSYEENIEVTAKTASGDMSLPATIEAGLSVFQGMAPYRVQARLKTRITERKLVLYFETVQMHAILRENIMSLVELISGKTEIVPLLGNP